MPIEIRYSGQKVSVQSPSRGAVEARSPSSTVEVSSAVIGGGTMDYERLANKPCINGVELSGDRPLTDFVSFGSELVYESTVLDVDVMTAQQVANLLTDD